MYDENLIRSVVAQVLAEVGPMPPGRSASSAKSGGRYGIFYDANDAVAAARVAFEQLRERTIDDRSRIIDHIRRIAIDQCVELGTMEMDETKIGRLEHKIEKLKTLGERTPGVEFLRSEVFSGDHGLAVIEHAPFGVIGAITPVTHSLPTITGNAVSMIAGGNTRGRQPASQRQEASPPKACDGSTRRSMRDLGIDNLICVIAEPTLETADAIFKHRGVDADLRHRRPGRRPGGAQQRQASDRRRPGQSAGRRRRDGRPRQRRPLHHSGRRVRQQPALHRREGSLRRRQRLRRDDGRDGAGRRGAARTPARSTR